MKSIDWPAGGSEPVALGVESVRIQPQDEIGQFTYVVKVEGDRTERKVTMARLSDRVDYSVGAHDVTLRGECPDCRAGA